jgi:sugar-specific transcriptional regulator TrmB
MNIRGTLEKLGLNKKQADVYLACLEHGPVSMTLLAERSGYRRSTLYNIVADLLRKDYVILIRRNRRTLYDAERPKKLLTTIRARQRELEVLLPELERIRDAKQPLPRVEIYETETAVRHVYDEVYDFLNQKTEACFMTSVGDFYKTAPTLLNGFVAKFRLGKDYKVRELIYNDEDGRRYVRAMRERGVTHPIRLLPAEFPIYNDFVTYSNKVILTSLKHRITATVFDNPETATTLKTLFEWAWSCGEEV